jgi:hypothetical protein
VRDCLLFERGLLNFAERLPRGELSREVDAKSVERVGREEVG